VTRIELKRVLFLVSTLRKSGPTQQLLNLSRHLPEFGYTPLILTLSPERESDTMEGQFRSNGIELQSLKLSRITGAIMLKSRVRKLVSSIKPAIIHSQGVRSDIVAHHVHNDIPHVLTVRNSAWDDYPPMFGKVRGSLLAWRHLSTIRRAQYPVACSESLAAKLTPIRPGIATIQNGVDLDNYTPASEAERRRLRVSLGVPTNRRILLHLGSLIARKRPELLLRAFAESELSSNSHLIFVGDGPLRAQLQNSARGLPNVQFTGAITNVDDYLRSSDVLVSSSASEGLPSSVLEALACGLPVVLSKIPSHEEIGAHQSGAGCLVDPRCVQNLSGAISSLLSSDREELSRRACAVAHRFSSRATAMKYAKTYALMIESA